MTVEIPVYSKKHGARKVLIDESDSVLIEGHTLCVVKVQKSHDFLYVRVCKGGRYKYLHRFIMQPAAGADVDHINGNPLDNRRENLRIVCRSTNLLNRRKLKGFSKYRAVFYDSRRGRWYTKHTLAGKRTWIGYYATEIEAARAYDDYVIKNNLPNQLNFPIA